MGTECSLMVGPGKEEFGVKIRKHEYTWLLVNDNLKQLRHANISVTVAGNSLQVLKMRLSPQSFYKRKLSPKTEFLC